MGWGNPFSNAWQAATDAAKAKAAEAARTARSAYEYAKKKAAQARDYAKEKVRDAERAVIDRGYDAVSGAGEAGRKTYNRATETAQKAYDRGRAALGMKPAGKPVEACPCETTSDKGKDGDKDGWLMVPQGPGKPCIAVPPNSKALDSARKRSVMSQSACCQAKTAGKPPRDIIYTNGIQTGAAGHCDTLNAIAAQTCGRVVGVYNAKSNFAVDAAQTGQDRRLIKQAAAGKAVSSKDGRNPAVQTLTKLIGNEVRAGRPPELWAHSQGGAITSLALYEARNGLAVNTGKANPLEGVKVTSMGSAAPQWPNGPTYQHFIHVNDPVPTMMGLGHSAKNDAALGGAGAKVVRFAGDVKSKDPFSVVDPKKEWLPTNIGENHSVADSYLRMEKQANGGCP